MQTEQLGRFGHHPHPADDFCVEVERLVGAAYEAKVGMIEPAPVRRDVDRAMKFIVGGDPIAVAAKDTLREVAASLT